MNDDKIKALYTGLSKVYNNLGTLDEFTQKLGDEQSRSKLYQQASQKFNNLGTWEEFNRKLGYDTAFNQARNQAITDSVNNAPKLTPETIAKQQALNAYLSSEDGQWEAQYAKDRDEFAQQYKAGAHAMPTAEQQERAKYFAENNSRYRELSNKRKKLEADFYNDVDFVAWRETNAKDLRDKADKIAPSRIRDYMGGKSARLAPGAAIAMAANDPKRQAAKLLQDAADIYEAPSKFDNDRTGLANYFRGMGNQLSNEDFWTRGLTEIGRNAELRGIQQKLQKGLEADENPTETTIDKILSQEEKDLLLAYYTYLGAQQMRHGDMSIGYTAGQSAIESLGFMAEFIATGGVRAAAGKAMSKGTSAAAKWLSRELGVSVLDASAEGAARLAARTAGMSSAGKAMYQYVTKPLMQAATHTAMQPGVYRTISQELLEVDDAGQLQSIGSSVLRGALDAYIENWSEMSGGAVEKVLGAPFKGIAYLGDKAFGGITLGKVQIRDIARWAQDSGLYNMMRENGFNGFLGEIGEEYVGAAARIATSLMSGEEFKEQMLSKEGIAELAASFGLLTGLGLSGNVVSSTVSRNRFNKSRDNMITILTRLGVNEDEINKLFYTRFATTEDIAKAFAPYYEMIAANAESDASLQAQNDIKEATTFIKLAGEQTVLQEIEDIQAEHKRNNKRAQINADMHDQQFWMDGEDDKQQMRRIMTKDGKIGYIVGGNESNWSVAYADGTKGFISESDIQSGLSAGTIEDTGFMSENDFLDALVEEDRKAAENTRMQSEQAAKNQELIQTLQPGTEVNIGTTEAPVMAPIVSTNADGIVVAGENGSYIPYTWQQAAGFANIDTTVQTDAEQDEQAAKAEQERDDIRAAINAASKNGLQITHDGQQYNLIAALEWVTDEQTGEDKLRCFTTDALGQAIQIELTQDEVAAAMSSIQLADEQQNTSNTNNTTLETPVDNQTGEAGAAQQEEMQDSPAPAGDSQTPYGLDKKYINPDGSVNETTLWNDNPREWARYNDEKRGDDGANSKSYLGAVLAKLDQDIAAADAAYASELDFAKRDALEQQKASLSQRRAELAGLLASYNLRDEQRAAEEAARVKAEDEAKMQAEEKKQQTQVEQEPSVPSVTEVPIEQIRETLRNSEDRMSFDQYVRAALDGAKIIWASNGIKKGLKDLIFATGTNANTDRKKYIGWLANEDKGGRYLADIIHGIWNNLPSWFEGYTDTDVRDSVLDALLTYNSSSAMLRSVYDEVILAQQRAEQEEEQRQKDAYARDLGFSDWEDYETYNELIATGELFNGRHADEEINEIYSTYGEESERGLGEGVQGVVSGTAGQESSGPSGTDMGSTEQVGQQGRSQDGERSDNSREPVVAQSEAEAELRRRAESERIATEQAAEAARVAEMTPGQRALMGVGVERTSKSRVVEVDGRNVRVYSHTDETKAEMRKAVEQMLPKGCGITVEVYDSWKDAPAEVRSLAPAYADAFANNGKVYINLSLIPSRDALIRKVLHEGVAHIGMKQMLGKEGYDALCEMVWDNLSDRQKQWLETTKNYRNLYDSILQNEGEQAYHRAIADEYIAYLSERTDMSEQEDDRTLLEKIVDYIRNLFGIKVDDEFIQDLLRQSWRNILDGGQTAQSESIVDVAHRLATRKNRASVADTDTRLSSNIDASEDDFHKMIDELLTNPTFDKTPYLRQRYNLGETPYALKAIGLKGDEFSLSFKTIKEHINKDADHNLTIEEWHNLPAAIKEPFLVTKYGLTPGEYRLYLSMTINGKTAVVGIDVIKVNKGKDNVVDINKIKTTFGKNEDSIGRNETIVAYDEKITPEQEALLREHNYREYPTIQELSEPKGTTNSGKTNNYDENNKYSVVTPEEGEEAAVRYSTVTDSNTLGWLNSLSEDELETGYRTVELGENDVMESPMGNSLKGNGMTTKTEPFGFNEWEQADEHPELADDNSKVDLIKPDGKAVNKVDYNPYIHIRPDKVNVQFRAAWNRPNLVYIKTVYPKQDLVDGKPYKADKAVKAVGRYDNWNGGTLILSRYDKPQEKVSWESVADDWMEHFGQKPIHFDIISPHLLPILAERGANIVAPHKGMGQDCVDAYNAWKDERMEPEKVGDAVISGMDIAPMEATTNEFRFSTTQEPTLSDKSRAYLESHKKESNINAQELEEANRAMSIMYGAMIDYVNKRTESGLRYLPEEVYGRGLSTIYTNGSYGRTMENTLKCIRTLAYDDFVDAVKTQLGRPLTSTESFLASQMLYDIATDPQCLYCYVSLDRKAYDEFLLRYMENRDAIMDKYRQSGIDNTERLPKQSRSKADRVELPNSPLNNLYREYLEGRADTPNMRDRFNKFLDWANNEVSLLTLQDLATDESRELIRNGEDAVLKEQLKDAESYAQSASWAKKKDDYRAYNGELLRLSPNVVNMLKKEYGLRFYSFSEYTPAFILENMQMMRDAALRGLNGLAYTKEVDFVKIFAPSGCNINCSCYGRRAEDGTVVPDTKQGADWDEVKTLREQYGNVGAVFVAVDDEMVEWALNQEWIDVIIPFHIVRTGADIASFYNWSNYSSMQADKSKESARTTYIPPTEHHNNKETFLTLCDERGLKPRFADVILPGTGQSIVEHPNYMKVVNETRRSIDETEPLKPKFDMDAATKSWDAFVEKGGYYSDWYHVSEKDRKAAVQQVAEDIQSGKTAKDVDYGRQDIKVDAETLRKLARKAQKNRQHGNTPRFSTAYHGSPAEFDAFDNSHMGEGEGAQAHGWGTYVTFDEETGRGYARRTTGKEYSHRYDGIFPATSSSEHNAIRSILENIEKGETIEQSIEKSKNELLKTNTDLAPLFESIDASDFAEDNRNRNLYTVEIPDDNGSNYLTEGKTIPKGNRRKLADYIRTMDESELQREQHGPNWMPNGLNTLANVIENNSLDAREVREKLVDAFGSERKASGVMSAAGFVGIKYNGQMDGECAVIFDAKDAKIEKHIRFSTAIEDSDPFYSNAARALEGIKQNKATAQQWLAMLQKAGGLKAEEDKWMGLSDWLNTQQGSIEKSAIEQFIADNAIKVKETKYSDSWGNNEQKALEDRFGEGVWNAFDFDTDPMDDTTVVVSTTYDSADFYNATHDTPLEIDEYGDITEESEDILEDFTKEIEDFLNSSRSDATGLKRIDPTRLAYTTKGLENNREIALTVPTIEPYNERDEVHFGDAGEGRAVAWVRFGDAKYDYDTDTLYDYSADMSEKYGNGDGEMTDEIWAAMTESEKEEFNRLHSNVESGANSGRVLVIDEIQSKRHQDGREKGYKTSNKERISANERFFKIDKERRNFMAELYEKYPSSVSDEVLYRGDYSNLSLEDREKLTRLNSELDAALVASTQANNTKAVPDAPFRKNWHELAMKRMLRLAAEEGYDKIAWTNGMMQAERYDLGRVVQSIGRDYYYEDAYVSDNGYRFVIYNNEGWGQSIITNKDGVIIGAYDDSFEGKNLSELVGKDTALKMMSMNIGDSLEGNDLMIGGDGMKGFYDKILVDFMNKYGKKWGVKVSDIKLPGLQTEEGWHSIDVTPEMKENVMQGQPMFSVPSEVRHVRNLRKDLYRSILDNGFDDVTLQKIDSYLEGAYAGQYKISERLPDSWGRGSRKRDKVLGTTLCLNRMAEAAVRGTEKADAQTARKKVNQAAQQLLEDWAKATGYWFDADRIASLVETTEDPVSGSDSKVYIDKDGVSVIKASHGKPDKRMFAPDRDFVAIFNDVFPDVAYELLGFGRDEDGEFFYVTRQQFIFGRQATQDEIQAYMESKGFKQRKKNFDTFYNDDYIISDLKWGNVLVTPEGSVAVIDADCLYNTTATGGKRAVPDISTELPSDNSSRMSVVTPEQDAEYQQAYKDGDTEKAVQMVKDAARAAGYTIPLYRVDATSGLDKNKYQDTEGVFYAGDLEYYDNSDTGYKAVDAKEFLLASNTYIWNPIEELGLEANNWSDILGPKSVFDKYEIEDEADTNRGTWNGEEVYQTSTDGLVMAAKRMGYEGVVLKGIPQTGSYNYDGFTEYAIFNSDRVKSADPFTFDDNGELIPLNQRFNEQNDDIRYSTINIENAKVKEEPIKLNSLDRFKLRSAFTGIKDGTKMLGYVSVDLYGSNTTGVEVHSFGPHVTISVPVRTADSWSMTDTAFPDGKYIIEKDGELYVNPTAIRSELEDALAQVKEIIERRASRFSTPDNLEEVNDEFNNKLSTLTEKNANSVVLNLGRPSEVLVKAGVEDKPMKLYGSKVVKKMKKHGFTLSELNNLPKAVADPIAVFDNYRKEGNRSILTELKTAQGNFLVSVEYGRSRDIDFNIVSSVFGKGDGNLKGWLKRGSATYINNEKVQNFLFDKSALIAAAAAKSELSSGANIRDSFELNKLLGEKLYIRTNNFKNWFGDWEKDPENSSKVVDENGEPLVVYHSTDDDISIFDRSKLGENTMYNNIGNESSGYAQSSLMGFWFNTDKLPDIGNKSMPVFLNIRNPYDAESLQTLAADIEAAGGAEAFLDMLRWNGYDGLWISDEEMGGRSYVAFEPNQIKSATDNNGNFDPSNPDIRYSTPEVDAVNAEVQEFLYPDRLDINEARIRNDHAGMNERIAGLDVTNMDDIERSESAIEKGLSGAFRTYYDGMDLYEHPDVPEIIKEAFSNAEYRYQDIPKELNRMISDEREDENSAQKIAEIEQGLFWFNGHKEDMTLALDEFFDADGKYVGTNNVDSSSRYSVIGTIGMNRIMDGEGMSAMMRAKQMDRQGRSARLIKRTTGWEKGIDGKWRFELPDGHFKDDVDFNQSGLTLGDIWEDERLYRAYPYLSAIPVETYNNPFTPAVGGFYSEKLSETQKGILEMNSLRDFFRKNPDVDSYKASLQERLDKVENLVRDGYEDMQDAVDYLKDKIADADKFYAGRQQRMSQLDSERERSMSLNLAHLFNGGDEFTADTVMAHEIQHMIQEAEGFANGANGTEEGYSRYAGEVEARNVAGRMGMTPEQRRNSMLEDTEDVKRDVQIIRFSVAAADMADAVYAQGLRTIAGHKATRKAWQGIYRGLADDIRKKITDDAGRHNWSISRSVEAYFASLAENVDMSNISEEDIDMWSNVRDGLSNMLGMPLGINDAMWMVWNDAHSTDNSILTEVRRAKMAHKLGFSEPARELKRAALAMAQDDEIDDMRYSVSNDVIANAYNLAVESVWNRQDEIMRDQYASVNALYDAYESETSKAQSFEDARLALNQRSSRGAEMLNTWRRNHWNPMMEAVRAINKRMGIGMRDVERYVMLKHILERNDVMAAREARQFYKDEFDRRTKEVSDSKTKTDAEKLRDIAAYRDIYDQRLKDIEAGTDMKYLELREKDYGGIMGMYTKYDAVYPRQRGESEEAYQQRLIDGGAVQFKTVEEAEDEARREVNTFEGSAGSVLIDNLWQHINGATKSTLYQQYRSGMINREQYETARDMYEYYVPLRGFDQKTAQDLYTYYTKAQNNAFQAPLKQAHGRTTMAASPFGYIGAMASSGSMSAAKNESKLAFYYFISNRRDASDLVQISDMWYRITKDVDANGNPVFEPFYPTFTGSMSEDAIRDEYEKWLDEVKTKEKLGVTYFTAKDIKKHHLSYTVNTDKAVLPSHMIEVMVAGERKLMFVNGNPRVAQAINGELNMESNQSEAGKVISSVLRYFASVNTSYNPEFWISNLQRDMLFSIMAVDAKESKEYKKLFRQIRWDEALKVPKMKKAYKKGTLGNSEAEQYYREFVENGGVTGFTTQVMNEEWERELINFSEKDVDAINEVWELVQIFFEFGEAIEQMTRFTAYMASRKSGKDIAQSVADAKDLTVNFNRKGSGKDLSLAEAEKLRGKDGEPLNKAEQLMHVMLSWVSFYGRRYIMFYNAAVQGIDAMYKLYKANPKKMWGKWTAGLISMGATMALLHALLDNPDGGDDGDEYLDIPDYERRNNLLLGYKGRYLKWALPQEARAWYALGDLCANWAMGRIPHKSIVEEALNMVGELAPIDPMGGVAGVSPSATTPVIEVLLNKDYKGARVYNDRRYATDWDRKNGAKWSTPLPYTGKVYVAFTKALSNLTGGDNYKGGYVNLDPNVVEHLLEGYTGGLGTTINKLIKAGGNTINGEFVLNQTPFARRLFINNDDRSRNAYITDLWYYYQDMVEGVKTLMSKARKDRNKDAYDALKETYEYKVMETIREHTADIERLDRDLKAETDKNQRKAIMKEQDALRRQIINEISNIKNTKANE